MSARRAYLDTTPGEIRGVVTLDGRPEHLMLARDDDDPRLQPGARIAVRVRKVEPAFASCTSKRPTTRVTRYGECGASRR